MNPFPPGGTRHRPRQAAGGPMIRRMIASAVVAAAVIGPAGPATAGATGPASAPRPAPSAATELTLAYMADAGYAVAVVLTCDPPGGVHPEPARACATLEKVSADPGRLRPVPRMCTLEYAPITAELTGSWRGRTVDWRQKYPNTCDMLRSTGVLFAF